MSMPHSADALVAEFLTHRGIPLPQAMERLRTATYTGRDPDNLVTATVDGDATVTAVRFATTIGMHQANAVADAIRIAVNDAQDRMAKAWLAFAADLDEVSNDDSGQGEDG